MNFVTRQLVYAFALVLGVWGNSLLAQQVVRISAQQTEVLCVDSAQISLLAETENFSGFGTVSTLSDEFIPLSKFGKMMPGTAYWGKIILSSELDYDRSFDFLWLSSSAMRLNLVETWVVPENGTITHQKWGFSRSGKELEGTTERDRIRILLRAGEQLVVYFRVQNTLGYTPQVRIHIVDPGRQFMREAKWMIVHFAYEGMLWIMILYSLLIFWKNRDKAYFYYAMYISSSAFYTLYYYKYLLNGPLTDFPFLNAYFWLTSLGWGTAFYLMFLRHFLNTRETIPPSWNKAIWVAIVVKLCLWFAELTVYTFWQPVRLLTTFVSVMLAVETLFSIVLMVVLIRRKVPLVRYFAVGSISLWVGMFTSNILYMFDVSYSLVFGQVAVIVEILAYSVGLGQRMRLLQVEKEQAQELLIDALQQNEEKLEQLVKVRTEEIERKNILLNEQYMELEASKGEIEQQKEEIVSQNEKLLDSNDEQRRLISQITDSIVYAKRIQTAVMPPLSVFESYFKDYFVLYKPRDVVSGDFYWAKEVNGKIIVAAVDCTGHGVPGAFLSLLGITYLGEIVNYLQQANQAIQANTILELLRERIKNALHSRGNRTTRDGMDMALFILDKQASELQFAGAHNPLLIVRKHELIEHKGDRMPIGAFKAEQPFVNHHIKVYAGDKLYIFTDGITDQFGGDYGNKFMISQFRETIHYSRHLSMTEQLEHLEAEFNTWTKDYSQLDDILVMGFEL